MDQQTESRWPLAASLAATLLVGGLSLVFTEQELLGYIMLAFVPLILLWGGWPTLRRRRQAWAARRRFRATRFQRLDSSASAVVSAYDRLRELPRRYSPKGGTYIQTSGAEQLRDIELDKLIGALRSNVASYRRVLAEIKRGRVHRAHEPIATQLAREETADGFGEAVEALRRLVR